MKTLVLIPVKDPDRAKQRMAPLLSARERARLAWSMFEQVSRAVLASVTPETVVVVTDSKEVSSRALSLGWEVLLEKEQVSESASVDTASRQLVERRSAEAILRLPADLPLIQPEDIAQIIEFPREPGTAVLVPSWNRMGTNAVLRSPPDLFPSRFGHNSLVLHLHEAMRVRAKVTSLENRRIALDLDDASDLERFLRLEPTTDTHRLLLDLDLQSRLDAYAVR